MSTYKQKPALEDLGNQTVINVVRMSPDGVTKEHQKKLEKIKEAYHEVVDNLKHDCSRELCKLTDFHKEKIKESIQLPKLIDKPLVDKAAHFMAESAFGNVRVKNTLGTSKEDRQSIVLLLKDLGVKDDGIMLDLLNKKIPYDEKHRAGLITVLEDGEYKNPETLVYARLYERYMLQLQTTLKE